MYPNSYSYPTSNSGDSFGYAYNQYGATGGYNGTGHPAAAPGLPAYGVSAPMHDPSASLSNPAAFERMYGGQLAQLTFNSKPIITNLTLIAQEHVHRMSTLVAKLIDAHIMMTLPVYRLPSMYLLDSISKNIGSPYTELWASRVSTLFLESYRVVDQPTKRRMEELLATWRTAGPGGRPLFGDNPQMTIERALFGSEGPSSKSVSNTSAPTQSQVLANVERLLALKSQERSRNPNDSAISERFQLLRELKNKIQNTNPSPELLTEVQQELDVFNSKQDRHFTPPVATVSATSTTENLSASDLIANLMKAGLLPSSSSSTSSSTPAPVPPKASRSQDQSYTDYILSLNVQLTSFDLSRPPPDVELVVKDHLPLSCRQCANRYPDTAPGKNGLDLHLDWHFSQNRRARASIARGQSRSWFDPVSRWIRSGFDQDSEHGADNENGAVISPMQEQTLKEKFANTYVVVPSDPDLAARPCRICQERFQSEWSEDVEEWIWRNAMEADNGYVHASCHYSAKTMSETVKEEPGAAPVSLPKSETTDGRIPIQGSSQEEAQETVKQETTLKRKASPTDSLPHKKVADDTEDRVSKQE
ncbi:hypothetical protein MYAM1_001361 [Malassezia yamatoensis]|uniref:CID domain-containing protein n=1 Tax=Malassezia yamatoensis TaxID=253288 RepID=A0AAJ5YSX1_9BASI|nr:hypothetical protein MYAM1_001361 [Malassezia yamatoensis]